jgi:hypothetical protein
MELKKFDALKTNQEQGVFIDIVDPVERRNIGLRIKIAGYESERVTREQEKINRERVASGRRGMLTLSEVRANNHRVQAAAIIDWEWALDADGQPGTINGETPAYSAKLAHELISTYSWIGEQIDEKAGARSTFL